MECCIIWTHRECIKEWWGKQCEEVDLSSVGMRGRPLWEVRFQAKYREKSTWLAWGGLPCGVTVDKENWDEEGVDQNASVKTVFDGFALGKKKVMNSER